MTFVSCFLVNIFIVLSQSLEACYWLQYEPLQTYSLTVLQTFTNLYQPWYKPLQKCYSLWHNPLQTCLLILVWTITEMLFTSIQNITNFFADFVTSLYWSWYKLLQKCYSLKYKLLQTGSLTLLQAFTDLGVNHYKMLFMLFIFIQAITNLFTHFVANLY